MQNKKVVFFLLLILITAAMGTLLYHKYVLIPKGVNDNFQPINDHVVKDLMMGKKGCIIQAGLPLGLKALLPGQFEIISNNLIPLKDQSNFKVGHIVLGSGFISNGDEVGKTKTIELFDPFTRQNYQAQYQVILFSNCF